MQPRLRMMISKKSVNKVLKSAIAVLPAIPFLAKRRSSPVLGFVLGGIGVAVAGGIAALMFVSPRTRNRALGMAKDAYGKVNSKIEHARDSFQPNGIASEHNGTEYTTGL